VATAAIFPRARCGAGMYEAFFLRAYSPSEPLGVWIRHTVHKPPGGAPVGSVWCTVFDAARGRPFMHKSSSELLGAPDGAWIEIGEQAVFGPARVEGSCGQARWALRYSSSEPELRHLSPGWLYRLPLPRTKLTSPAPAASFDGVIELGDRDPIELDGWPGVVGHNWGSEHAERWVWLHASGFREAPTAWLDVALGRLRLAGRLTPWVANGVLSIDGRRRRIGGLGARGLRVRESPEGASIVLPGEHGLRASVRVQVPAESAAGWRYADPRGGAHDVVNCSIASLELDVELPGESTARAFHSAHGGVYELGMRERSHGIPLAPFADGEAQGEGDDWAG
jgi:hypothetical protein